MKRTGDRDSTAPQGASTRRTSANQNAGPTAGGCLQRCLGTWRRCAANAKRWVAATG